MLETILKRRSIRKYTEEHVTQDQIKKLLQAAMQAPSAGNQQPWRFLVINDRGIMEKIPNVHPYASMLPKAPVAILVCGDLSLEKHKGYWVQDCAAATQNLLLAAEAMGLGAVWLGVYPMEDRVQGIRTLFSLPENFVPFSLIPVGKPVSHPGVIDRFNPDRVTLNNATDPWK